MLPAPAHCCSWQAHLSRLRVVRWRMPCRAGAAPAGGRCDRWPRQRPPAPSLALRHAQGQSQRSRAACVSLQACRRHGWPTQPLRGALRRLHCQPHRHSYRRPRPATPLPAAAALQRHQQQLVARIAIVPTRCPCEPMTRQRLALLDLPAPAPRPPRRGPCCGRGAGRRRRGRTPRCQDPPEQRRCRGRCGGRLGQMPELAQPRRCGRWMLRHRRAAPLPRPLQQRPRRRRARRTWPPAAS